MMLLSLLNYRKKPWFRVVILGVFIFLAWQDSSYYQWSAQNGGPILVESPYNSIRIMDGVDHSRSNAPVRLLATDPGYTQSGMLIDSPDELYFDYTRFYALGPKYNPAAKSILMLGGGGYSVPKWLLSGKSGIKNPEDLSIDVLELDPAMTSVARKYFGLSNDKRLKIRHEDARSFLNSQPNQYDLIFVDVFNSHYSIPFQMGTKEAAKAMRKAIAPGGVLLMNIISAIDGDDGRLFRAIWQAFRTEFAKVQVYCVGRPNEPGQIQNLMLVAFPDETEAFYESDLPNFSSSMSPNAHELANMEKHLYKGKITDDVPPLTDEYSPVERYALMLTRK